MSASPAEPTDAPAGGPLVRASERLAGRNNLLQMVQLRWLAVAGQLLTILVAQYLANVDLPLSDMLGLLALLIAFNCMAWLRSRRAQAVSEVELFSGLLVDVTILTTQLFYSGGSSNPFIYLYLLQVAVACVLLSPPYAWAITLLTSLCFLGLTQWHLPLNLPGTDGRSLPPDYVGGLLIAFLINASLLVIFIGRIERNLRQRDARLAALRQRAAEEEHIVRMGLLASGAAHELGTPLATLSVILGDWARMAPFAAEPELREEIEQMQIQVKRCKNIVTGILQSAGETRGEAPEVTTLHAFLDGLVLVWCQTRSCDSLSLDFNDLPDLPIISDTALKQMVDNVLDNALEAQPAGPLQLIASASDEQLTLCIRDQGPGFTPTMLEHLGRPYESSKGKPGRGLGLFLSVNVARTLGGRIEARNLAQGGAEVVITLPLATLTPTE